jgi:hypothetical protein
MQQKFMVKKLSIRCADLEFENRILHIRFLDGIELELEDVKEIFQVGLQLSDGKPYCALADVRNNPLSSPEARAFGADKAYSEFRLADAILVESTMMKLIASVYINFNKPKVPTRMFNSEEKALSWLKEFLT